MFDKLSDGFHGVFRRLSGQGAISESNVREAMEEVRTALLEADVHYDVVESFVQNVLDDAVGQEVTKSLKPGQEMIGIVHKRLVSLLGGDPENPDEALDEGPGIMTVSPGPTVIMMCGLQGSGKTTTCGKLAGYLKKRGRSVMLAAADLQRPAAVEQLETVASDADTQVSGGSQVHFYGEPEKCAEYGKAVGVAVDVCKNALKAAREKKVDVLILDTAGRLHVNDELMGELHQINRSLSPHHIFLVVDSMTGQDAVNSAKAFHERLTVDGVVLTKLDSDTRGGAAISVKEVTGAPIRFAGVGEKMDALEPFNPHRMAGRILGMGDVVSLVEKARDEVTEEEAAALEAKMARGEMTMDDLVKQLRSLRKMGPLKQLMGMLPGMGQMLKDVDIDDKQLDRTEAIVLSMTAEERKKPKVLNPSRRRRIAQGAGSDSADVSRLAKQFDMLSTMTQRMASMSAGDKLSAARAMSSGGGDAGGMASMAGLFGGKGGTKTAKRGVKKRKPKKRKR